MQIGGYLVKKKNLKKKNFFFFFFLKPIYRMSAQQRLLVPFTKDNFDDLKKNAPDVIIIHFFFLH
jgi:hypothetical protein